MKEYGKILYVVWADVGESVRDNWNKWVDATHIPEVISKGGFLGAHKFVVREGNFPGNYVTIYEARDQSSLKKYLDGPAKALRDDYNNRYGFNVKLSRIVLEEVASFEVSD